jgi:hypothetical protein
MRAFFAFVLLVALFAGTFFGLSLLVRRWV